MEITLQTPFTFELQLIPDGENKYIDTETGDTIIDEFNEIKTIVETYKNTKQTTFYNCKVYNETENIVLSEIEYIPPHPRKDEMIKFFDDFVKHLTL